MKRMSNGRYSVNLENKTDECRRYPNMLCEVFKTHCNFCHIFTKLFCFQNYLRSSNVKNIWKLQFIGKLKAILKVLTFILAAIEGTECTSHLLIPNKSIKMVTAEDISLLTFCGKFKHKWKRGKIRKKKMCQLDLRSSPYHWRGMLHFSPFVICQKIQNKC